MDGAPQVLVVDDFLSKEALAAIRAFALDATVFFDPKSHDHVAAGEGYLGAYASHGVNRDIFLQLEQELRAAFPRVIGDSDLRNLWFYKYSESGEREGGGIGRHADESAINLNLWLTPDDANLDPAGGGLEHVKILQIEEFSRLCALLFTQPWPGFSFSRIVLRFHDRIWTSSTAPLDWGFNDYNSFEKSDGVKAFLEGADKMNVPYRQNRAIIFNGNFFHKTSKYNFKQGYKNRRLNLTLLFGDRGKTPSRTAPQEGHRAERAQRAGRCEACHAAQQAWCYGEPDELAGGGGDGEGAACPGACVSNAIGACACGPTAHTVSVEMFEHDAAVAKMVAVSRLQVGCTNDYPMEYSKFYTEA